MDVQAYQLWVRRKVSVQEIDRQGLGHKAEAQLLTSLCKYTLSSLAPLVRII